MIFKNDIPSVPIDIFKNHLVLLGDLTSMHPTIVNCHFPELLGEPLSLELKFNFPLEHDTEFIVLGDRMSSVTVDNFGVVVRKL